MSRTFTAAGLIGAILSLLSHATHAQSELGLGFTDLSVGIADTAVIDWRAPNQQGYANQREAIEEVFAASVLVAGERKLTGARPVRINVSITHFDILSATEQFFCCAKNEVSAMFEIVDAASGEVVYGPELLKFDHLGIGGLPGLLLGWDQSEQLRYLSGRIESRVEDWIAARTGAS